MIPNYGFTEGSTLVDSFIASLSWTSEVHLAKNLVLFAVFMPISIWHVGLFTIPVFFACLLLGPMVAYEIFFEWLAVAEGSILGSSGGTFVLVGISLSALYERDAKKVVAFLALVSFQQVFMTGVIETVGSHAIALTIGFTYARYIRGDISFRKRLKAKTPTRTKPDF